MEYKSFLVKYGEIGVKGKNRYKFEDALVRQLGFALKKLDCEFNIVKEHGRIYVDMLMRTRSPRCSASSAWCRSAR